MKCITLWQPWAVLLVVGFKRNETRSWATSYRGDIAVHAAAKRPSEIGGLSDMFRDDWPHWSECMQACGCPIGDGPGQIGLGNLDYGAIIGVVRVKDCVRITTHNVPTGRERAFGDYTPGRFMWVTNFRYALPKPVPFKGRQGLFEVPDSLVREAVRG